MPGVPLSLALSLGLPVSQEEKDKQEGNETHRNSSDYI